MLIILLLIFGNTTAQTKNITINIKDASIEDVLKEIQKQTGLNYLYNHEEISDKTTITINAKNESVNNIMEQCLKNTELTYIIVNNVIIIKPNKQEQPTNLTQTFKGNVVDMESQISLPGANIVILNTNPLLGTISDPDGNFKIENVPIGRYNIKISYVGYNPVILPEILIGSGKEVYVNAQLKESVSKIDEAIIKAYVNKDKPLNSMATLSARTISVEESRRYAGGLDDPARMVSSFAGVTTGNLQENGIAVRGNSPKGILWRLEGVKIPNPNHFANISTFGGGGVTAFSSLLLTNSDFFAGAFPAEYGDALSGVLDFKLRSGNNEKREHAFQAGALGVEFASEGPFKKGKRASYLFNYRYSTFGLIKPILPDNIGIPVYEDLSFKLNFPTKKAGNFSLWGIGANDDQDLEKDTVVSEWESIEDQKFFDLKLKMGAAGLNHKIIIGNKTYINSVISASGNKLKWEQNIVDNFLNIHPNEFIETNEWRYTFSSFINHKFNKKHTNRTGIIISNLHYNINIKYSPEINIPLIQINDDDGQSYLMQCYSQSKYSFTDDLTLNAGIHSQYLLFNENYTVEPRIGLSWNFKPTHTLSFAYGNHSQMEPLGLYFVEVQKDNINSQLNKNLEFTRAHHIVLAYDKNINEYLRLKIEPYVQFLYNVPVINDSCYSTINMKADWFVNNEMVNEGTGRNIGIELTLERFLNNGYYYLLTASVFDSKYKDGDDVLRNTRYNNNFVLNFLFGKEWKVGKTNKNNMLGVNGRYNIFGGERTIPVLEQKSIENKTIIYNYSRAFEEQKPLVHHLNLTVTFRKNKANHSSIWALQVLNLLGSKDYYPPTYNYKHNRIDEEALTVMQPVISYKIEF
ncbi:secretin and TonB N-terminal domain-containing protein [Bacteroidota bacterium]